MRSISKDKGLCGFYKLKKTFLLVLLLEQSSEEIASGSTEEQGEGKKACTSRKDNPKPSRNGWIWNRRDEKG